MGARTETRASRMTGMGTKKELPSLPHCLPMQPYPHAFLLGLLQKKCILTNQWCVQRVCRERRACSELLAEKEVCAPDPASPSTLLNMTLKSRQGKKLRPPQTTPRWDFTREGDPIGGKDGPEGLRLLLEVCQPLQSMPLDATSSGSV